MELIKQLEKLVSENQNPETLDIDLLSTNEMLKMINSQDLLVAKAVSVVLPQIAEAVDIIAKAFVQGGRLIYIGAGTSGRLGVLDAVECMPTFGVEDGLVIGVMAGGEAAMFKAKEGIEDDPKAGEADLHELSISEKDVIVGIAASGRTPYVVGGLRYAQLQGAKTVSLSSNPDAEIAKYADINITPVVGPEPLAGSTRMKSGTAQKMVLNMLSTASMIKVGKSYQNLMIDLKATNEKLRARAIRMVMQVTGATEQEANASLIQADGKAKLAIFMLLSGRNRAESEQLLIESNGVLRKALQNFS
ncbi:MAG: N-acetylmuramic acid 6-phosphate etherase [Gammaproteobacteria bacterium]|nr:N-acetylmuramic acid 6-phosphate etherase [Gammaproteobacteria bacterium]MDH5631225.1 N-acetylmuramic acid 6-phosphate etherase [Gammaproteobacteria bacterium]